VGDFNRPSPVAASARADSSGLDNACSQRWASPSPDWAETVRSVGVSVAAFTAAVGRGCGADDPAGAGGVAAAAHAGWATTVAGGTA
jgi:hypothetical protein